MGKVSDRIAGVVATGVLVTNSFFQGADKDPMDTVDKNEFNDDNIATSVVQRIDDNDNVPNLKEYISNVSDGIETYMGDKSAREDRQDDIEAGAISNSSQTAAGSGDPPKLGDDKLNTDEESDNNSMSNTNIEQNTDSTTEENLDSDDDISDDLGDSDDDDISDDLGDCDGI